MLFKKSLQAMILGITLFCIFLLFSVEERPIMAATLTETESISPERISAPSDESLKLELEVDHFLTSIPAGYYTIPSIEGLKSLLKDPQAVLVDVRELSEYRSGHIPNAINIPLRTLAHNLDKIDRDRPIVLYCSTGYRSAMGVMTLHLLGYDKAQGFPPSFAGWKIAGEAIAQ